MIYDDTRSQVKVSSVTFSEGVYIFVLENEMRHMVRGNKLSFCEDQRPGIYCGDRLISETAKDLLFRVNRGLLGSYEKSASKRLVRTTVREFPTIQEAYSSLITAASGIYGVLETYNASYTIQYYEDINASHSVVH